MAEVSLTHDNENRDESVQVYGAALRADLDNLRASLHEIKIMQAKALAILETRLFKV